jgi:phosphopantothenoylcysteine decarboxylase/phosphopantothenate--cysteine ligase
MGYRLAEAAWRRGADVLLISGPSGERPPEGVTVRRIESTAELERAVAEALPETDVLVMAAAPADYRAREVLETKRPRQEGGVQVALEPTRDILSETRGLRKLGAVMVGFALETGDAEAKGRAKLARKALDLIVINDANEPGAGFEVETNRVTILDRDGGRWALPLAGKAEVAEAILDRVEARLG